MIPLTPCARRARSGITLTEILISIMIMGVGLVSLATLFPLGMLRIREAARNSRSGLLAQTAYSELSVRGLLSKASFLSPKQTPWYQGSLLGTYYTPQVSIAPYDPWKKDGPNVGSVTRLSGPGLPVCYDPMWIAFTNYYGASNPGDTPARFAIGTTLRNDPIAGRPASDYGLQRITNFSADFPTSLAFDQTSVAIGTGRPAWMALQSIFVSQDDIVFNSIDLANRPGGSSPILPAMVQGFDAAGNKVLGSAELEYAYSWFFTGYQADVTDDSTFIGDIVVCHNRPFAVERKAVEVANSIKGTAVDGAAGETVVEAIFGGPRPVIDARQTGQFYGYAPKASRAVLLRWPADMPDPEVRVGGWIADVTYEYVQANIDPKTAVARNLAARDVAYNDTRQANGLSRLPVSPVYPMNRCHWYQVVRKTPSSLNTVQGVVYREMTVTVGSDLKAFTMVDAAGTPPATNAALIMPSVVNVFPRTVVTR